MAKAVAGAWIDVDKDKLRALPGVPEDAVHLQI